MIVPPSPTGSPAPAQRLLRAAGLVLAPVLLVAVVMIGVAGPRADPGPTDPRDAPAPTERVTPAPAETGAPTPAAAAIDLAGDVPPAFPAAFAGLWAAGPADAIAQRSRGDASGPLLVEGFLKMDPPDGSCDGGALGPLGPWCARTGILAQRAWAVTGADFDPLPAHLHVTLPLGVRLPEPVARMATAPAGSSLPVAVIGRFTGTACQPKDLARCEEPFVIDRITWADGARAALTPLVDDRLQTGRRPPNPLALSVVDGEVPLLAVLAWPETVARLDPGAAGAAAGEDASRPVWYLRVMQRDGVRGPSVFVGTPVVRWLLLDERRLQVIATGRTEVIADPSTVVATATETGPFPDTADHLLVHSLDELRGMATSGSSGPIAAAGYLQDVRAGGGCRRDDGGSDAFCTRIARLEPRPTTDGDAFGVTVRIKPGVRLPADVTGPRSAPVAAVLIGQLRFDAAACDSAGTCEVSLDADRVAWANGAEVAARPLVDAAIGTAARARAAEVRAAVEHLATGRSGTVLVSALVRGSRLADVDASASSQLGDMRRPSRAVWYVRALETGDAPVRFPPGDVPPRINWVVADASTGEPLAWGSD